MKKAGIFQFASGFILGALVFGGTVALASGIVAQPGTADVVIDGWGVDLKGYVIDGSHYFQLRDVSHSLRLGRKDFSVVWDGVNNRVLIDTRRGYDQGEAPVGHTTDFTPPMPMDWMKAEVVRLTNVERIKAGLPGLEVLPELMVTAQAKADDMLGNNYYGHISPKYGTPADMIRAAVPSAGRCAENIASWTRTPEEVVAGLMESPRHRDIILSPFYTHFGIGIVEGAGGGYWWVQHFCGM